MQIQSQEYSLGTWMNSRPARKTDDYEEYQVDSPRKNRGHWIKKAKLFQTENAMTCKYNDM